MLSLLANPWSWVVIGVTLLITHGGMYYQGRVDGGAHEALNCEIRVSKLQGKYEEQAKQIEDINKKWQKTLDTFIDSEAERAKIRQEELDKANEEIEDYKTKLSEGKTRCLLDELDLGSSSNSMQLTPKR